MNNKISYPEVLLISNKFDFSTDFISVELYSQNIPFLRINRDELKDYNIQFDPINPKITGSYKDITFEISSKCLRSIYYRAPSFLRDIFQEGISEEEQLIRTQWAAFVRSLIVFNEVKWLNNPVDIYQAEIKPFQLFLANKIGFDVPKSIISNSSVGVNTDYIAIKSIDTAIVTKGDTEGFVYTEIIKRAELENVKYTSPFFNQQGLIPKVDIRVTVVEKKVIAVKITGDTKIDEDWRKYKNDLKYTIIDLPKEISDLCVEYIIHLNLNFGAIDLAIHDNKYYFIEINPTGEWSWLQQNTGYRFDKVIVQSLKE